MLLLSLLFVSHTVLWFRWWIKWHFLYLSATVSPSKGRRHLRRSNRRFTAILQWLHHPINDFGNLVARLMGIDSEQDIYWVIAQLYSFSLNENDHMTIIFALKHRIRFCWRNSDYIDCNVVQGWFFHFWKVLQLMPLIIMHRTLFISTISWVLEFFRIVVRLRKVGMLPKKTVFSFVPLLCCWNTYVSQL